MNLITTFD